MYMYMYIVIHVHYTHVCTCIYINVGLLYMPMLIYGKKINLVCNVPIIIVKYIIHTYVRTLLYVRILLKIYFLVILGFKDFT